MKNCVDNGFPFVERPEILEQAIDIYGMESQIDMAIEEMSELIKALLKYRRSEKNPERLTEWKRRDLILDICEEVSDVYITICQIVMLFDCNKEFKSETNQKIDRLEERIEKM